MALTVASRRNSKITMATSAAMAPQYATAANEETVTLQERLQHEKSKKSMTHRMLETSSMLLNVRSAAPKDRNATTSRSMKFNARLMAVPVCGSVPRTRTERSMMKRRKEKKNPTRKGISVSANSVTGNLLKS